MCTSCTSCKKLTPSDMHRIYMRNQLAVHFLYQPPVKYYGNNQPPGIMPIKIKIAGTIIIARTNCAGIWSSKPLMHCFRFSISMKLILQYQKHKPFLNRAWIFWEGIMSLPCLLMPWRLMDQMDQIFQKDFEHSVQYLHQFIMLNAKSYLLLFTKQFSI